VPEPGLQHHLLGVEAEAFVKRPSRSSGGGSGSRAPMRSPAA
jgi:hypothetical protein